MSEANRIASGKRFATDLKQIREQQGVTIEEFHDETKISVALIESFEESGLFEHPMFNRVYLRSFVRTYADLVGLDTRTALDALERAMEGRYEHDLIEKEEAVDESPAQEDETDAPPVVSAASTDPTAVKDAHEEASTAKDSPKEDQATGADEPTGAYEDEADAAATPVVSGVPPGEGTERPAPEDLPVEEEDEVGGDWMAASPAGAKETSGEDAAAHASSSRSSLSDRRRSSRHSATSIPTNVIAGAAVIVILGAIVFFLFRSGDTPDEPVTDEPDAAAVDTAEAEEIGDERPPVNISLGELMNFTVVAEGGPIQGIRITRDSDLRRPYWIEEGDATVFPASQRIVIEEELDNLRLLLEGYDYPTDRLDEEGRLVINREVAESFADTARGEPFNLTVEPDTNQVPSP